MVADDRCTEVFPTQFPSILRVTTLDGKELVEEVMANRGGDIRPLSYDELALKFADNAGRVLSPDQVSTVADLVAHLEDLPVLGTLFDTAALPDHPGS